MATELATIHKADNTLSGAIIGSIDTVPNDNCLVRRLGLICPLRTGSSCRHKSEIVGQLQLVSRASDQILKLSTASN